MMENDVSMTWITNFGQSILPEGSSQTAFQSLYQSAIIHCNHQNHRLRQARASNKGKPQPSRHNNARNLAFRSSLVQVQHGERVWWLIHFCCTVLITCVVFFCLFWAICSCSWNYWENIFTVRFYVLHSHVWQLRRNMAAPSYWSMCVVAGSHWGSNQLTPWLWKTCVIYRNCIWVFCVSLLIAAAGQTKSTGQWSSGWHQYPYPGPYPATWMIPRINLENQQDVQYPLVN